MPRSSVPIHSPADDVGMFAGLSPNQVVAYNLARARADRGWTQDQARKALAPFLGTLWSKANYSAAERSVAGGRIRQFDADEIVAFARGFGVPIGWFFMPPDPAAADGATIRLETPDSPLGGAPMGELVDLVFGDPESVAILSLILRRTLSGYGDTGLSDAERRIADLAWMLRAQIVRHSFSDIDRSATSLHALANQLEDLVSQAKTAAYDELGIPEGHRV